MAAKKPPEAEKRKEVNANPSSSSSSDDDDSDMEEDFAESQINMREKLRSATTKIDKIPPSIEELEEGDSMDLVNL